MAELSTSRTDPSVGPEGAELEGRLGDAVRGTGLRLLGPNGLGLMHPRSGLNASFAPFQPAAGHVGVRRQSGASCTAVLAWSRAR